MKVDIALATYNGSKFLGPLLRSFDAQSSSISRIVASDDGSTDETLVLLNQPRAGISIEIAPARPRGNILLNFENAILSTDAPYVALSDQDDVWHHQKLDLMLARMGELEDRHGAQTPVLVFCDLEIVDRDLRTISRSFFESTLKSPDARNFADYVLNNHVPGCAMLVNRALIDRAVPFPDVDIHDHWLIQVAALFGQIGYVDQTLIKYRQHGANNIGLGAAGRGKLDRFKSLFGAVPRRVLARRLHWERQAAGVRRSMAAIKARFGDTIPEPADRALIDAILFGDLKAMHHGLKQALTGERSIDYWGLLWTLSRSVR